MEKRSHHKCRVPSNLEEGLRFATGHHQQMRASQDGVVPLVKDFAQSTTMPWRVDLAQSRFSLMVTRTRKV
jgi:hypothetical protein